MDDHSPRDPRDFALRHVRDVAAARVRSTSLRGVAREVGMSPTGLKKFLQGTAPYSPTVRRLRSWYVRYGATPATEVRKEEASAALELLMHDLPPEPATAAADGILESLGRSYELSGRTRPRWVAELRAEYRTRRNPL